MKSPFPGMDPFIESRRIWPDFHLDLAAEIRAYLNARIQPGYYATVVTYVTYDVIEVTHAEPCAVSPDVSVWRTEPRSATPVGADGSGRLRERNPTSSVNCATGSRADPQPGQAPSARAVRAPDAETRILHGTHLK